MVGDLLQRCLPADAEHGAFPLPERRVADLRPGIAPASGFATVGQPKVRQRRRVAACRCITKA